MYRSCPQHPMPYYGMEMQNPFLGMEFPYFQNPEFTQNPNFPGLGMGMQYPFYPCPGPGPMPPMPPMPCPGVGFPPVEVQAMVREMLEMVRSIYEDQCPLAT